MYEVRFFWEGFWEVIVFLFLGKLFVGGGVRNVLCGLVRIEGYLFIEIFYDF